ncbi:MAG: hypothetical protein AAF902_11035 [Chloroflexota bacterium]
MESGFLAQARTYLQSRPVWMGFITGVGLTLGAVWIRPLTLFRYANDPLQLVQPIIQLRFGLINFNWQLPLFHLGFVLAICILAPLGLRLQWPKHFTVDNALLSARTAAIVSFAYIWWLRVDALPVLIWYAISSWVSFMLISWITKSIADRFSPASMRIRSTK